MYRTRRLTPEVDTSKTCLGCANRDEQTSKGWPFSLLNDEQMSNKVRVEHQPECWKIFPYPLEEYVWLTCPKH